MSTSFSRVWIDEFLHLGDVDEGEHVFAHLCCLIRRIGFDGAQQAGLGVAVDPANQVGHEGMAVVAGFGLQHRLQILPQAALDILDDLGLDLLDLQHAQHDGAGQLSAEGGQHLGGEIGHDPRQHHGRRLRMLALEEIGEDLGVHAHDLVPDRGSAAAADILHDGVDQLVLADHGRAQQPLRRLLAADDRAGIAGARREFLHHCLGDGSIDLAEPRHRLGDLADLLLAQ